MSSKSMEKWAGIFIVFSVAGIILELFSASNSNGVFVTLIMSTIFNVGAAIMEKLESIKA